MSAQEKPALGRNLAHTMSIRYAAYKRLNMAQLRNHLVLPIQGGLMVNTGSAAKQENWRHIKCPIMSLCESTSHEVLGVSTNGHPIWIDIQTGRFEENKKIKAWEKQSAWGGEFMYELQGLDRKIMYGIEDDDFIEVYDETGTPIEIPYQTMIAYDSLRTSQEVIARAPEEGKIVAANLQTGKILWELNIDCFDLELVGRYRNLLVILDNQARTIQALNIETQTPEASRALNRGETRENMTITSDGLFHSLTPESYQRTPISRSGSHSQTLRIEPTPDKRMWPKNYVVLDDGRLIAMDDDSVQILETQGGTARWQPLWRSQREHRGPKSFRVKDGEVIILESDLREDEEVTWMFTPVDPDDEGVVIWIYG